MTATGALGDRCCDITMGHHDATINAVAVDCHSARIITAAMARYKATCLPVSIPSRYRLYLPVYWLFQVCGHVL